MHGRLARAGTGNENAAILTRPESKEGMDIAARITSKGQITIPKSVREALNLGEGDQVVFRVIEGERAILARTPDLLELAGSVPVPAGVRGLSVGRDPPARVGGSDPRLSAFVDSNILVRHLTGDPPDQARRATEFLRSGQDLVLVDLVVAEVVYVLESVYELERERVAELVRAIVGFPTVVVADEALLLRALEIYEQYRIHFAESYLAACAELSGVGVVASFDRDIDRVPTIRRLEPSV